MKLNKKGFTLIELLVVIMIIGILFTVINPRLGLFQDKATMAGVMTDMRSIEVKLSAEYRMNRDMPTAEKMTPFLDELNDDHPFENGVYAIIYDEESEEGIILSTKDSTSATFANTTISKSTPYVVLNSSDDYYNTFDSITEYDVVIMPFWTSGMRIDFDKSFVTGGTSSTTSTTTTEEAIKEEEEEEEEEEEGNHSSVNDIFNVLLAGNYFSPDAGWWTDDELDLYAYNQPQLDADMISALAGKQHPNDGFYLFAHFTNYGYIIDVQNAKDYHLHTVDGNMTLASIYFNPPDYQQVGWAGDSTFWEYYYMGMLRPDINMSNTLMFNQATANFYLYYIDASGNVRQGTP